MKKVMVMMAVVVALSGCKDRVLWDSNGAYESPENREIWNTNGQVENSDPVIWRRANGEDVIK